MCILWNTFVLHINQARGAARQTEERTHGVSEEQG